MSLASLAHVPQIALRTAAARERLLAEGDVVLELDALVSATATCSVDAQAYLACAIALARDPVLAARLHASAVERACSWACMVLEDAAPARALLPRGRLLDARASAATVRVRRREPWVERAPSWERHFDHKVLAHPDATVVWRLLASPTARAGDVVKIASRRPTTPALLGAVATHPRWIARHEVREALVKNPFLPTRFALLYLPTLRRTTWSELGGVSRAHPLVREAARRLLRTWIPPRAASTLLL